MSYKGIEDKLKELIENDESGIVGVLLNLILNNQMNKITLDPLGRMLVKIDVAGTATGVTVASGGLAANSYAVGAVRAGAFATGAITDLPFTGQDHEKVLAEMAFMGIRSRMEFIT